MSRVPLTELVHAGKNDLVDYSKMTGDQLIQWRKDREAMIKSSKKLNAMLEDLLRQKIG